MSIPQNLNDHHGSEFTCHNPSRRCNHHTLALSAIAHRHNAPGNHPQRDSQGMHTTPNKNRMDRITPIITDIPRLIRNIRHHNPQANLQVGLTSLSICSFSFPCFAML
ncbi:MAG: hypothetical protein MUP49_06025 [Dehalococcoidia bacterium]|nr:hypothetical protein [Dehalococcoidia bacterium]